MVNKCVVFGCKSGYVSQQDKVPGFSFPLSTPDLLEKWIKFVNRVNWKPTKHSIICVKHFEEEFISQGKRMTLKWKLQPIPTIHTEKALKRPSTLPTSSYPRKSPKIRIYQQDEIGIFKAQDVITSFDDLTPMNASPGYQCYKTDVSIVFYNITFTGERSCVNKKPNDQQVEYSYRREVLR